MNVVVHKKKLNKTHVNRVCFVNMSLYYKNIVFEYLFVFFECINDKNVIDL